MADDEFKLERDTARFLAFLFEQFTHADDVAPVPGETVGGLVSRFTQWAGKYPPAELDDWHRECVG